MSSPIYVYFYQYIGSFISLPPSLHVCDFKNIFNFSNNTKSCSFKVFHNENGGKISYYPVLPFLGVLPSRLKPGGIVPPGFSQAVNTLPTLVIERPAFLHQRWCELFPLFAVCYF